MSRYYRIPDRVMERFYADVRRWDAEAARTPCKCCGTTPADRAELRRSRLNEQLATECARLCRMEAEADAARDSRGHRSPVDLRILAEQRKTVRMVCEALIAEQFSSDKGANQ